MAKKKPTKRARLRAGTRTGQWKAKFLANLAVSGVVGDACRAASVCRDTAYTQKAADEAFAAAWGAALEEATDLLESEARRRAYEGLVQKKFTKGGEPIIDPATGQQYTEREYSDNLLTFLLRAHRPEKFRDNLHVTGEVPTSVQIVTPLTSAVPSDDPENRPG